MAKKKSTAALEGEEIAPSPPEETVVEQPVEQPVEEETTPDEAPPEEETAEEVSEEPLGLPDVTKIKLLIKGPIRGSDGRPIAMGQTGEVLSSIADALVGRGQAEIV